MPQQMQRRDGEMLPSCDAAKNGLWETKQMSVDNKELTDTSLEQLDVYHVEQI